MNKDKIVHICTFDKFITPFVLFNEKHCSDKFEHIYFLFGKTSLYEMPGKGKVFCVDKRSFFSKLILIFILFKITVESKKIFLHGLFDKNVILYFFVCQFLLKKTFWIMWGADLYADIYFQKDRSSMYVKFKFFIRNILVKKFTGLVTYLKGDFELARQKLGARGDLYECIMYPSNLFTDNNECLEYKRHRNSKLNIMVGNSADYSNNHLEIFEKIKALGLNGCAVFVPLSYGFDDYRDYVIEMGKKLFGDYFFPITKFIPLDKYKIFLSKMDVAIFNHKRQQAMGTTIQLLGKGKLVLIRKDTSQWQLFKDLGVVVGNVEDFEIKLLDKATKIKNHHVISDYFSPVNYANQLINLYSK